MKRGRLAYALLLVAVGCSLLGGCARGHKLGKVSGTVTFDGKPIQNGKIVFEVPGARPATGSIVEGKITDVTTFQKGDGVPVGTAKIAVFANESETEKFAPQAPANPGTGRTDFSGYMGMGAKPLVPPRYNNPATSGLTWEIKPGENVIDLQLTR